MELRMQILKEWYLIAKWNDNVEFNTIISYLVQDNVFINSY